MSRTQQKATILNNSLLQGSYYRLDMRAEAIAPMVRPGQFVHMQLPGFEHRVLRRPFSICDVDTSSGRLTLVYKTVGEGTRYLAELRPGALLDLMGPLGNGYSVPPADALPVIIGGGYGCAATYLYARRSPTPPLVLLGGRSRDDLLLVDEFRALDCEVRVSTDDGSEGHHGLVTDLLDEVFASVSTPCLVACGPNPMLRSVSRIAAAHGVEAELSLDHVMCCGVGACFACVVKMKADNADGWEYVRTCRSGPVFRSSQIYWED